MRSQPVHRLACLAALLLTPALARPAAAAEIEGKLVLKAKLQGKEITLGCATADRRDVWLAAKIDFGVNEMEAKNDSVAPRVTVLNWTPKTGITFKHSRLPAGWCLVYVRVGDWYVDWKWVDLKDDQARVKVDFAFDPAQAGTVELTAPRTETTATLVPLDGDGQIPFARAAEAIQGINRVDLKAGKAVLKGLRPGKYRFTAGNGAAADVEVKKGQTAKAELVPPG
jgi:hypothetical protein